MNKRPLTERATERVSEGVIERVSERVSERISERVSERAAALIAELGLVAHPEGGWFAEHHRDDAGACTAIYFLLAGGAHSAWHRVAKDELWHHYEGAPVVLHLLDSVGGYRSVRLASVDEEGGRPCVLVPSGTWQAASPDYGRGAHALLGNTVAPAFSFSDWTLADEATLAELRRAHPEASAALDRFASRTAAGSR